MNLTVELQCLKKAYTCMLNTKPFLLCLSMLIEILYIYSSHSVVNKQLRGLRLHPSFTSLSDMTLVVDETFKTNIAT